MKAAYLYNFVKFVDWPEGGPPAAFTICVYGKDPFGGILDDAVRGRVAHGLPLRVRRLTTRDEGWDGCQVIFFGMQRAANLVPVLARLEGRGVLTVGDSEGFAEAGGMLGLVVDHDRVRFEINLDALAAARLKASSRLIDIGRVVRTKR